MKIKNHLLLLIVLNLLTSNLVCQTIYRSNFYTIKIVAKEGKTYVSPNYAISYILIAKNEIDIHIFDKAGLYNPQTYHNCKIINNSSNGERVLYYTEEKRFISIDHKKNTITVSNRYDSVNYNWIFSDIKSSTINEFKKYYYTFNVDNPKTSGNLSKNSHNLTGFKKKDIIIIYSKKFTKPADITKIVHVDTNQYHSILIFKTLGYDISHIIMFNKNNICNKIIEVYPLKFFKNIVSMYNESYGYNSNHIWYEKTYNCTYKYQIFKKEDVFTLQITKI